MISQSVRENLTGDAFILLQDSAGNGLTSTLSGGKQGLDVFLANADNTADLSTFTEGTSSETPIGGVFNESLADVVSGKSAAARITKQRAIHMNLRDSAGVELGGTAASGLFVRPSDGTNSQGYTAAGEAKVSVTQPLPAGTNLIGKATVSQGGNDAIVTATGAQKLDGSAVTQPISATALPLPAGAATEVTVAAISAKQSPGTAVLTQIAYAAPSTAVLAANAARKGLILHNDSNKAVKIGFAATTTSAAFTLLLQSNAMYEAQSWVYTGAISALWTAAATGNLAVTELT